MASIVLKKRNFNQMVESSILVEEPILAPKRFLDEQGKLANSFAHYLERLSIMFPDLSPQQLSTELASNGNDVLATIENLRSRAKNRVSNKLHTGLAEKTNPGNTRQGDDNDQVLLGMIDETLTELTQCQNTDSARSSLYKFAKKIKESSNPSALSGKEKKLVAENEILKQAFKILQKQLLDHTIVGDQRKALGADAAKGTGILGQAQRPGPAAIAIRQHGDRLCILGRLPGPHHESVVDRQTADGIHPFGHKLIGQHHIAGQMSIGAGGSKGARYRKQHHFFTGEQRLAIPQLLALGGDKGKFARRQGLSYSNHDFSS